MTQQPSYQTQVLYHLTDQFIQFHSQQVIYLTVLAHLAPLLEHNTEAGDVTAWITVTDIDETGDTMTVGGSSVGAMNVTIGTTTCFTAGGLVAYDAGTIPAEKGPLSETVIGSSTYETSFTIVRR